jgi:4-oxalocrotonate tautomerase
VRESSCFPEEVKMPHIIIKMTPGRTMEQKEQLAKEFTNVIIKIAKCEVTSVSIAIEEIERSDWKKKVYIPYIIKKAKYLIQKPGYEMEVE